MGCVSLGVYDLILCCTSRGLSFGFWVEGGWDRVG